MVTLKGKRIAEVGSRIVIRFRFYRHSGWFSENIWLSKNETKYWDGNVQISQSIKNELEEKFIGILERA